MSGHEVRYEKTDVRPGAVAGAGAIVGFVSAIVAILMLPLILWYAGRMKAHDPEVAPMAQHETGRQPPEPRLQARPFEAVEALRAREALILSSLKWVDQQKGIVQIPIERAMQVALERLPVRGQTPEPPAKRAAPARKGGGR